MAVMEGRGGKGRGVGPSVLALSLDGGVFIKSQIKNKS